MFKRCTLCGISKPHSEFQKERRSSDGITARCKPCLNAQGKAWRDSKGRQYHRVKRYGIKPEEYEELLDEQQFKCACCGSSDPKRKAGFVIDHDHDTGAVRGLLCHNCNIGIGMLGDSVFGLQLALEYLRRYNDKT